MNKFRPFISGTKSDDVPDCYNRVRYIRDACKILSDVYKTDKDFLNKSFDNEISKSFKDFRSSEVGKNYRSPYGSNGAPSILNRTIDELVQIHDFIDSKRKESLEQIKKIIEQAKDKQSNIRQTMTEVKENYEKAQRRLETADTNLKKFQTRSDRYQLANYDERSTELEDIRNECEQTRTLTRDIYVTEIYKIASEEHFITQNLFSQYLFEQNHFYNEICKHLSSRIPIIEQRLEDDDLTPSFHLDLIKHCSKRCDTIIAYPIEISIRLLENSLREEGLFRIAPAHNKQKKFVSELDLQLIERSSTLNELGYDPHVPANTLKQYLRGLPNCLLTSTLFEQWNQIPQLNNEQLRLERISQLLKQLPKIHYENLNYLVRFLTRVAEYSSENKMNAANLEQINKSTLKSQPDLIPMEFHSKNRSNSNENLLENSILSVQPSPGTRRKNKAPPPPPSSSAQQIYQEETYSEQIINPNPSVVSSSSFTSNDKVHRRTPSDGIQLDRPNAPPPLPPPVVVVASPVIRSKERLSIPLQTSSNYSTNEQTTCNEDKSNENDTVNVGKLISELNNRMAAAKLNNNNNTQTNNIRVSSIRNSTLNSPGETTDF
ncbi:unnamed protein product [Adineta ricciae]|uniref:Rho-GAP domain-containing protein n=1 Tax=Adineta ricciae TaxID=249248 RepID=A0A814JXX1_ADIRI|nr:unnamed protein product [Adineta ricciae]